MAGMLRIPRSRGALSGVLLVLLGIWGGLIPFIGPYFHFAYTPNHPWVMTSGRVWLDVVPGAAALIGGLVVLASRSRPGAVGGATLATLSGIWFAAGPLVLPLRTSLSAGMPAGGAVHRAAEQLGFYYGLGAAIVFFAALALGRFTVVGVRDAAIAADAEAVRRAAPSDQVDGDAATAPSQPISARLRQRISLPRRGADAESERLADNRAKAGSSRR
ncbi:MAG TPA: hypothetical protein VGI64_07345 [Streptosporangiaceae bacterium]|jgi:hypothetical protein